MSPRRQSPPTVEYVLLGLLRQKPMHGYDLHKALEQVEGLSMIWTVKQSQLYALLERLESVGWVKGKRVPGENRPARMEYSLTSQGLKVLQEWLSCPVEHGREVRQELMAKLYFAALDGSGTALQLLAAQQQACQRWLANFQQQEESLGDSRSFEAVVLDFRVKQVEGILSWLNSCKERYTT